MAAAENQQQPGALSPVKQALAEIRRLRTELEESRRGEREPIAILGMAVRLPGGVSSPDRFWQALAAGEDLIGRIPPERWDADAWYSGDSDDPGTMSDVHGGFISDVDAFDADFFGINAREATSMDPQQRLLLELTWEALERSGIDPRSLMNSQTGIWIGLSNSDYSRRLSEDPRRIDGYTGVGSAASIAAGRIAYFLGTHGPAQVIDTACSSSLVAVHDAVQSLRRGETHLALVGAANLILSPEMNVAFSRTGMLSPTGQCHTFDAAADGYVRSEGCCVVVLKRHADAQRDGDPILAVIRGSAINQDGRSAGMTAPNGPAQESVMRAALANAGLTATSIHYLEAHGTGTPLGDPMEFRAVTAVYGAGRAPSVPLRIGSVKTNLGHTEAAAGLVGLIKVILMMQPGHDIVPHLHFSSPSSQIDWQRWPVEVPVALTPWGYLLQETRYAAVSSFGFSGTNVHLIVQSSEALAASGDTHLPADTEESLLCLSAAQESALLELASRYVSFLRNTQVAFRAICAAASSQRARLACRLAVRADSASAAANLLEQWLAGKPTPGVMTNATAAATTATDLSPLDKAAHAFVTDGNVPLAGRVSTTRIDLPVYPFQRRRFWFGAPTGEQTQRERGWQEIVSAAEKQSQQAPLDWKSPSDPERQAALERLTLAIANNVLAESGAFACGAPVSLDEILQRCSFQAIYRRLLRRWLQGLVRQGTVIESEGRFQPAGTCQSVDLEPVWRDVERLLTGDPGLGAYLRRCGAMMQPVLTGQVSALETLFPDGSFAMAEALYETGSEARYSNPIMAAAVHAAVESWGKKRNVRILEIGGGTGGTSVAVLASLPSGHAEYWFSDVSDLFLNRARRKFGDYAFLRYARFDLDRPLEDQEIPRGRFDVVLAANVVHAARDLDAALGRVYGLLAPGGVLTLLETTIHQPWFDISIGLIEGWQHFADRERGEHPLLDATTWCAVLGRHGFADPVAFPGPESRAASMGQHVLLARRPALHAELPLSPQPVQQRQQRSVRATREALIGGAALSDLAADHRPPEVGATVRAVICRVFQLGVPPERLSDRDRLSDLGMDSLLALELRSELSKALGLHGRISSTVAFDTGTVGELTRSLAALLESETVTVPVSGPASPPLSKIPLTFTVEALEEMTDEQVEELLKERLSKL